MPYTPHSRTLSQHTAPTDIHPLSLHDALPISREATRPGVFRLHCRQVQRATVALRLPTAQTSSVFIRRQISWTNRFSVPTRSEEHTSELQSHHDLVCRLLLEKKKNNTHIILLC